MLILRTKSDAHLEPVNSIFLHEETLFALNSRQIADVILNSQNRVDYTIQREDKELVVRDRFAIEFIHRIMLVFRIIIYFHFIFLIFNSVFF